MPPSEGLTIPDDGSWLHICLADPGAPDDAEVTETNVKVLVAHPDPGQLDIRLTRAHADVVVSLSPEAITPEGLGRYTQIHDFDGLPSQGEWIVQIRDTAPGAEGRVESVSIALSYTPGERMPLLISGSPGKPTSSRIPADAVRIPRSSEPDEEKGDESPPEMQLDAEYTEPIMTQTFEGIFPPAGWSIYDANPNDGKEYYWDDDDLRPYNGYWAAWPARGGADGINPTQTTTYPKHMHTWMIYGPFDLSNAQAASVSFMLWRQIEVDYDHLVFAISSDGVNFSGWLFDGDVDWEYESFDLGPYLGDSDVWIGWRFMSDGILQYAGPWIDDITLEFVPGDVTVQGTFRYADRSGIMRGADAVKVQLWDRDASGGDDLLAETIADSNGHYSFDPVMNWDVDDTDPVLGNRRLDLYVLWILENDHYKVTRFSGTPYAWISPIIYYNIDMGNATISSSLPAGWTKLEAMWIFQDIRRAREYYLSHTSPPSDPGFLTAHWEEDQNTQGICSGSCFWAPGPYAFIADESVDSGDTIVHELAHHIMWNLTGQWLWYDFGCWYHEMFGQESAQCAWSEGWADFFAIAVNGDACYDFDAGPCTGNANEDYYDLENHTRNDDPQQFAWGDGVEGRVAGALYDLMDSANESPWYDTASWGFAPIVDIALAGSGQWSLQGFWSSYQGANKHDGVRSIYQNTIDYDQAPVFAAIPDQRTLQNHPRPHLLDLWSYTSDAESPNASLTYQVIGVSDSRCGISLDGHWVNANPQMHWSGSCYVTLRVSDSIKTATGGFWLDVVQITDRTHLPSIMKE